MLGQFLDVLQPVLAEFDDVVVLQEVLLDLLTIHEGAVGAVLILEEGIMKNRHDNRMHTRNGQIVDLDIVLRLATNGDPLLVERDFLEHQVVHAEYELSHLELPSGRQSLQMRHATGSSS